MKTKGMTLRLFGVDVFTLVRTVEVARNAPRMPARDGRGRWVAERIVEKYAGNGQSKLRHDDGNPFAR